jgi:RimJ/RimL family protein N-acetyltransferase
VEYGFAVRGLHRLQADTLASNTAMIRAAARAGFVHEGRLRQAARVSGDFADEVILGILAADRASSGNRQMSEDGIADT